MNRRNRIGRVNTGASTGKKKILSRNMIHPHQEVYTRRDGWMPIGDLFLFHDNPNFVEMLFFNPETFEFTFDDYYDVCPIRARRSLMHFRYDQHDKVPFLRVDTGAEILASVGSTGNLEFIPANELREIEKKELGSIHLVSLETIFDVKNRKEEVRMVSNCEMFYKPHPWNQTYAIRTPKHVSYLTRYYGGYAVVHTENEEIRWRR